jgi:hypothetical protein
MLQAGSILIIACHRSNELNWHSASEPKEFCTFAVEYVGTRAAAAGLGISPVGWIHTRQQPVG